MFDKMSHWYFACVGNLFMVMYAGEGGVAERDAEAWESWEFAE